MLAVTDHDTTEGLDEALDASRGTGLRVVPGIEISSHVGDRDVHILGLGVDPRHAPFQKTLTGLCESRVRRIRTICERLRESGVDLDAEAILTGAAGKSVGRKHVARLMVEKGLVKDVNEAFRRYLGHGAPAWAPAHELVPREAAALIRAAGGVPILAHPGLIGDDALLPSLLGDGVMGFEVYHKYRNATCVDRYLGLAERYDVLISGGSDFHGDESRTEGLLGEFTCPPREWRRIERMIAPAGRV